MDKILRRVRMAERQVARRNKRRQQQAYAAEKNRRIQEVARLRRQASYDIGAAVKARHEDLELGPLAPRRDVSKVDPYGNYWGSISTERALLQVKVTEEQRNARAAWAGGARYLCLAPGDRVVVVEGPYKDKIATVESINRDIMAVELGGNVGMVSRALSRPDPPSPRPDGRAHAVYRDRSMPKFRTSWPSRARRPSNRSSPSFPSRPSGWCTRSRTPRRARPAT